MKIGVVFPRTEIRQDPAVILSLCRRGVRRPFPFLISTDRLGHRHRADMKRAVDQEKTPERHATL